MEPLYKKTRHRGRASAGYCWLRGVQPAPQMRGRDAQQLRRGDQGGDTFLSGETGQGGGVNSTARTRDTVQSYLELAECPRNARRSPGGEPNRNPTPSDS